MAFKSLMRNVNKDRISHNDSFWDDKKKNFAIGVASSFILIQLLFLGLLSYLYGAVYQDTTRVSNFNILMIDYDGGAIGQSLRQAVTTLSGPGFPSISERPTSQYESAENIYDAVFRGDYWAAVYTTAGASQRLTDALSGAGQYNSSDAIIYVYNEARYPTAESGYIAANMQQLISVATSVYQAISGPSALQTVNTASDSARQALFNPIMPSSINIKPTPQGTKVLYNTVSLVMPIIMQFFFIMAVNGVSGHFNVYSHLPLKDNGMIRFTLSILYTFIGALCTAGYQSAFQESDWLSPGQFVLVWMIIWLFMHINFLIIDCATAFIPMSFIPFFFFSWVIMNIASVVLPFELNPGFYKWGYALPAHEVYQVLVTIWSAGAANQLHISLPVLFAWEVLLLPLAVLGLRYRCANARKEYEANEEAAREKYGRHDSEATVDQSLREEVTRRQDNREAGASTPAVALTPGVGNGYFPSTPVPFQNTLDRIMSSGRPAQV